MTTDQAPSSARPSIPDGEVIERFGGIRPMATKLGVAVTTVQGWKERGHIPGGRWQQIAAAAAEHGIDLGGGEASAPTSERAEEEAAPPAPPEKPAPSEKPKPPEPPREDKQPEEAPVLETAAAAKKTAAKPDAVEELQGAPGLTETPAPTSRPGAGVAWIAIVLAIVLSVGLLTRPLWEPALYPGTRTAAPGFDPAALDGIAGDLARVEEAVGRLERDAQSRGDELAARVSALEAGGGEAGAAFAEQLARVERVADEFGGSLKSLSGSLSRLEERFAALESTQGKVPEAVQQEIREIDGQVAGLRSDLEGWKKDLQAQGASLREGLDAAGRRLTELESRPAQTGEKIAALALAIGQVESELDGGRPYRSALDRLYALGRDDPLITDGEAMTALAPWADYGIPDRLALHRRFVEIAPQIARALAATDEETWLDSVWNSVKGLVTIRKIDGADGDLSPLTRAEIAMERGDLSAAVAAFEGAGPLGPEGEAWLNMVKNRIEAEREIRALYGRVIAPLAGGGGAEKAPAQ